MELPEQITWQISHQITWRPPQPGLCALQCAFWQARDGLAQRLLQPVEQAREVAVEALVARDQLV